MGKILQYLKDPKLWELWYIPYYGSCRILYIIRRVEGLASGPPSTESPCVDLQRFFVGADDLRMDLDDVRLQLGLQKV